MPDTVKKNLVRVSLILAIIGFAGVEILNELRTGLVGLKVEKPELLVVALGAAWLWLLPQYWTGIRKPGRKIFNQLRDDAITHELRKKPQNDPEHVLIIRQEASVQIASEEEFVMATCVRVGATGKTIKYKLEYFFRGPERKGKSDKAVDLGIYEIPHTQNLLRQIRILTIAIFTDVDAGNYWGPLVIAAIPVFVWLPSIMSGVSGYFATNIFTN